jgi:Putative zinc-finger
MDETSSSEQCLDAETVAAMADGGLSPDEQSAVAEHALTCPRCREVIAAVIRTTPEPPARRAWWRLPSLRWLAPALATGLAVVVWVAVAERFPNVTSVWKPVLAPEKREAVIIPRPQEQKAKTDTEPARKAFSDRKPEPPKQEAPQEKTAGGQAIRSDALTDRQSALQRERSKTEPVNQLAAAKATQKLNQETLDKLEKTATDATALAQPAPAAPPPPASPAAPLPTASNEPGRAAAIGGARAAGGAGRSGRPEGFADRAAAGFLAETVTIAIPDIASPDPRSRWRITGASVQRSTDNGKTWTAQETGTSVRLTAGSAPHADICWIVGDQGTVLVSVDGRSWQRLKSPDPLLLVFVSATSADAATVTTGDGRTFATTDRGQTWEQKSGF